MKCIFLLFTSMMHLNSKVKNSHLFSLLLLSIDPIVGATAAGNVVVLKPSEVFIRVIE